MIDGEHSAPLVKGERASERWRGDSRKLDITVKGIPPPPYGGPPPFDKGGWCPIKLSARQTPINMIDSGRRIRLNSFDFYI